MAKKIVAIVFVCSMILTRYAGPSGQYAIIISDEEKKPVVTCVFESKDANLDGIIELSELVFFEESGPNIYSEASGPDKGWQKDVNIKDIPPIVHGLKDLGKFKFNEG